MRHCCTLLFALLASASLPAGALEPFAARYDAYSQGKLAGSASMKLVRDESERWRMDLGIRGSRGFARLLALNIEQSTVFDTAGEVLRPLSQATVKHALFTDTKVLGMFDWQARTARWKGHVDKDRLAPVALQDGDMTALLMNLAVIRDAQPGRELVYRVVENGRAREYRYAVAPATETVSVGELGYDALRVARSNGGSKETVFWVAQGVPTPIRILQRENGEETLDLRLVEYQGVQ